MLIRHNVMHTIKMEKKRLQSSMLLFLFVKKYSTIIDEKLLGMSKSKAISLTTKNGHFSTAIQTKCVFSLSWSLC